MAFKPDLSAGCGVLLTVDLGAVRTPVEEDSRRSAVVDLVVVDRHVVAAFGSDDPWSK